MESPVNNTVSYEAKDEVSLSPSPTNAVLVDTAEKRVAVTDKNILQNFTPTPAMVRWFDTTMELGFGTPITEIAEKAEVARNTYYDWLREKPEFIVWFELQWRKWEFMKTLATKEKLDEIGLKKAAESFSYFKAMNQILGRMPFEGQAPQGGAMVQFNIGDIWKKNREERGLEPIEGENEEVKEEA
jgi:hypothetical protein